MKRLNVIVGAFVVGALVFAAGSTTAQAPKPTPFCKNVQNCQVVKDLTDKVAKLEEAVTRLTSRVATLEGQVSKPVALMNVQIETLLQDMPQGALCLRWDGTEHSGAANLLPCKSRDGTRVTHTRWNVVPQK